MTTKLIIKNSATSNGDVNVRVKCGSHVQPEMLSPGAYMETWISTQHEISIDETWPSKNPAGENKKAGEHIDDLIAREVAIQDQMWGDANERADSMKGQLLGTACAQATAIWADMKMPLEPGGRAGAFATAQDNYYPEDWSGFRDYGSDIANLVVAIAYLRQEAKRRFLKGESTERSKRTEPYKNADPYVSSAEALSTR